MSVSRIMGRATVLAVALVVVAAALAVAPADASWAACRHYVATSGSDSNPGSSAKPWATITHAVEAVPDRGCTITVRRGVYRESIEIERRFSKTLKIRSAAAARAVLESNSTVLDIDGARNVMVKGFEFRHAGRSANGYVVNVDNGGGKWAEYITFRDNVFHDSYDNDLMKVHAGARFVNIQGNVFYNQGDSEQHIDANSVTDVKIQDNIFFNDFGASGRSARDSKHFIVVKDSGKFDDGLNGSERVTLRRNVFMNWEGGNEAFVQIGNDGERYHEAKFVRVENNLFLGNSSDRAGSSFGVSGAKKVTFRNNTIVGNLPAHTFGFRIETKGSNPPNRNITFSNNIWSDHTGTMDDFTSGESGETVGLRLDTNLYWNGGKALPDGDVVTPRDDANRVVANPRLSKQHGAVVVPIWKGSKFASGAKTIRDEFVRIVTEYAAIPSNSGAVDRADPRSASRQDILGRSRGGSPDLGAFEAGARGLG